MVPLAPEISHLDHKTTTRYACRTMSANGIKAATKDGGFIVGNIFDMITYSLDFNAILQRQCQSISGPFYKTIDVGNDPVV